MRSFLKLFRFYLPACCLLLSGCHAAKTPFVFNTTETLPLATGNPETQPETPPQLVAPSLLQKYPANKTVAASAKKVRPFVAGLLPKPNATALPEKQLVSPLVLKKMVRAEHIRKVKDEPVKGPVYTLSGIFLALGMVLLLAALVMAIIGTGGAGTVALIGGGSFLIGSIFGLVSLLSY